MHIFGEIVLLFGPDCSADVGDSSSELFAFQTRLPHFLDGLTAVLQDSVERVLEFRDGLLVSESEVGPSFAPLGLLRGRVSGGDPVLVDRI